MKGKTALLKVSKEHDEDLGFDERNARGKKISLTRSILHNAKRKLRHLRKKIDITE